jgi:hypothetical protein
VIFNVCIGDSFEAVARLWLSDYKNSRLNILFFSYLIKGCCGRFVTRSFSRD